MFNIYFSDTQQSAHTRWGRTVYIAESFIQTFSDSPKIISLYLAGAAAFSLSAGVWVSSYAQGAAAVTAALLFVSVFLLLNLVMIGVAGKLTVRFGMLWRYGIRDACFLMLWTCAGIPCFPLILTGTASLSGAGIAVISAVLFVLLKIYYETAIAPKKKSDFTVTKTVKADELHEITASVELRKFRYMHETRNAFSMTQNHPVEIGLRTDGPEILRFAVAVNPDLSDKGSVGLKVVLKSTGQELYSGEYLRTHDLITRGWIPCEISGHDIVLSRSSVLEFQMTGTGRILVSEPRCLNKENDPQKIIAIVLDGVRPDYLGFNSGNPDLTPNIDRLASHSTVYSNAFTQANWTLPSFMSMLTGKYPSEHGVYHPREEVCLKPDCRTFAEHLKKSGFVTQAFFTHKRLVPNYGFANGFDVHYHHQSNKETGEGGADEITLQAVDALKINKNQNHFMMVHYFDAHEPYHTRVPYHAEPVNAAMRGITTAKEFQKRYLGSEHEADGLCQLSSNFRNEISRLDSRVGILIDRIKSEDCYRDALIVVLADHGTRMEDPESLTRYSLHDESIRVPFIVKYPGQDDESVKREINRPVPVNLELYRLIEDFGGKRKHEECSDDYVISEMLYHDSFSVSIRTEEYRYIAEYPFDMKQCRIKSSESSGHRLFRVNDSAGCRSDVSAEFPDQIKKFTGIADAHIQNILEE